MNLIKGKSKSGAKEKGKPRRGGFLPGGKKRPVQEIEQDDAILEAEDLENVGETTEETKQEEPKVQLTPAFTDGLVNPAFDDRTLVAYRINPSKLCVTFLLAQLETKGKVAVHTKYKQSFMKSQPKGGIL